MTEDELVEGVDYYMENGFMVFTAVYLRKRGFCCRSGCRHCPYGFVREDQRPSNSQPEVSPRRHEEHGENR